VREARAEDLHFPGSHGLTAGTMQEAENTRQCLDVPPIQLVIPNLG
jgi:hypothetical protein